MGAETAANRNANTRRAQEHKAYADFRENVRARSTNPAARQALWVVGTVPKDRLRDWMRSQRRVAKVTLRTRPDLKRKLGL